MARYAQLQSRRHQFPSSKLLSVLSWNKYKLLRMRRMIDAILDVIIEKHKSKQNGEFDGGDSVDVLISMQKTRQLQFPITNDSIKAVIFDMFSAGTDRNKRGTQRKDDSRRERRPGTKIPEISDQRNTQVAPSNPLLSRQCRDECKIDRYSIPLKAKVMIHIYALGRDPKYWKDPESFQPERFENITTNFLGNDFEFLPFGPGRRICPGLNFGLANFEFPLAQLLYHFDWKMPEGMNRGDVDMTEEEGLAVSRKNPLFLVPTVYNPSN